MKEFHALPQNVQTLRKTIWSCCQETIQQVKTLGEEAGKAEVACCHLASWTILNADAAIFLADNKYFHPAMSVLRTCIESQTQANYIANLGPSEREHQASEFLSMREFAKAKQCEILLNDAAQLAHVKATAPPDFPIEENCRKIVAAARAKLPGNISFKKHLKDQERHWAYANLQRLLRGMPRDNSWQSVIGNVDPYWVSGCMAIHGSPAAALYNPDLKLVAQIALHFSLGSTLSLILVSDTENEKFIEACKLFGECYPKPQAKAEREGRQEM